MEFVPVPFQFPWWGIVGVVAGVAFILGSVIFAVMHSRHGDLEEHTGFFLPLMAGVALVFASILGGSISGYDDEARDAAVAEQISETYGVTVTDLTDLNYPDYYPGSRADKYGFAQIEQTGEQVRLEWNGERMYLRHVSESEEGEIEKVEG